MYDNASQLVMLSNHGLSPVEDTSFTTTTICILTVCNVRLSIEGVTHPAGGSVSITGPTTSSSITIPGICLGMSVYGASGSSALSSTRSCSSSRLHSYSTFCLSANFSHPSYLSYRPMAFTCILMRPGIWDSLNYFLFITC